MTDRLVIRLKEKENLLHCVYLTEFNTVSTAFALQCNDAKSWYEGLNKARRIYIKLKTDTNSLQNVSQEPVNNFNITDNISFKKSPLGSSIGENALLSSV